MRVMRGYHGYRSVMMSRAQASPIRGCVKYATTIVSVDLVSISTWSSDFVDSQIKSRTSDQEPLETIATTKFVSPVHDLIDHF